MDIYMTIEEASSIMKVTVKVLLQLADNGIIRSTKLINGDIVLNQQDVNSKMPLYSRPEYHKYKHLSGNAISLSEADRRYGIDHSTLSHWVSKGFVSKLGQAGRQVLIDEAEIATYADIYKSQDGHQGRWIFNNDGSLYIKKSC